MPPGVCAEASPETAFSVRENLNKPPQSLTQMDVLTVDDDSEEVAKFFKLATSQFQRTKIPQDEVVVSPVRLKLVPMRNQFLGQGTGVGDNLFGVGLPSGLAGLQ